MGKLQCISGVFQVKYKSLDPTLDTGDKTSADQSDLHSSITFILIWANANTQSYILNSDLQFIQASYS